MANDIIKKFRGDYFFLSNFYAAPVEYIGKIYQNSEAAFQAQKVLDLEEQKRFQFADPKTAKQIGRKVKLRKDWEEVKDKIMYEICKAKFIQNKELKNKLINTGNAELQEGNSRHDYEWGICNGRGKNKLGKILMRVREELNQDTNFNSDMECFLSKKQSELDIIVIRMTMFMSDSANKYEAMKNQNWFKRMILTITGKNKATVEEIHKNNEHLNAYCAKALAMFVEQQRISEGVILNLGTQINTIYVSHLELKQIMHGIVTKLNEKIDSIDKYHLLFEEITLGKFGKSCTDFYRILALLDKRMISDSRKLLNLSELLHKKSIFMDNPINVETYLYGVCDTHNDFVDTVYMEASMHTESLISQITVAVLESWNLVPLSNRQLLKKQSIIKKVLENIYIDRDTSISLAIEYEQLVEDKRIMLTQRVNRFTECGL